MPRRAEEMMFCLQGSLISWISHLILLGQLCCLLYSRRGRLVEAILMSILEMQYIVCSQQNVA